MCGIVALINRVKRDFWQRDVELMEQMLVINSLRGRDSVGVFSAYRNNEVEALKVGSNPFNLFRCKEWDELKSKILRRGRIVVGHNRAATKGSVTTENAHPFAENNIMLVHNGTLYSHNHLSTREFDVDSNAIAAALSEKELEEVLPRLHGAFALVWYDTEQRKLFAIRNPERPLFLLTTDDMYVLSSEPGIAALPMQRQSRKIESVESIPPWTLVSFDLTGVMSQRIISQVRTYSSTYASPGVGPHNDRTIYTSPYDHYRDVEDLEEEEVPFVKGEPLNTPKKSCALIETPVNGTTITKVDGPTLIPTGSAFQGNLTIKELVFIAKTNTAKLQIKHATLQEGRLVVFKPIEISRHASGRYQFKGKIQELGEQLIDAIGYYPFEEGLAELETKWMDHQCLGRVAFVTTSQGGLSVFLHEVHLATMTHVYANHRIPMATWSKICVHEKCTKCGNDINVLDRPFTAVTLKGQLRQGFDYPINSTTIVCAYCMEDTLRGDALDAFKKERTIAWQNAGYPGVSSLSKIRHGIAATDSTTTLQNRESVGAESRTEHGKTTKVSGPPTLQ